MFAIADAPAASQDALPVCPWEGNPYRLVSLLDMLEFEVGKIYGQLTFFGSLHAILQNGGHHSLRQFPADLCSVTIQELERFRDSCRAAGFSVTATISERVISSFQGDPNLSCAVAAEKLLALQASFKDTCDKQRFLFIPADQRQYYDETAIFGPQLFGEEFASEFSDDVRTDAREAAKCYALDRWTACVFHSMRVAEHGLRILARHLRARLTYKGKRHPIEYADWDKVINGAKARIETARQLGPGPLRQKRIELYADAADHCLYMKEIWRNNVSHTRKPYIQPEAKATLERAQNFMYFIATRIVRK